MDAYFEHVPVAAEIVVVVGVVAAAVAAAAAVVDEYVVDVDADEYVVDVDADEHAVDDEFVVAVVVPVAVVVSDEVADTAVKLKQL